MRDIVLITGKSFTFDELLSAFKCREDFRVVTDKNRLTFEKISEHGFVEVEKVMDFASNYEDEEGDAFKDAITDPVFYLIKFKNIDLLKYVVMHTLNRPDVYIDNDFGLILPGSEFSALISDRPGWDWALDDR